jgi:3-phytase
MMPYIPGRVIVLTAAVVLLSPFVACRSGGQPESLRSTAESSLYPAIAESWVTITGETDNIDSVAVADRQGWVIATTKGTHQLLVFELASGEIVRRVGGPGEELGQFARPNGIAVVDDVVLVVERDNHRVQALRLPDFEPLGVIGADSLQRPYGIAVAATDDGGIDIWITDNFDWDRTDPAAREALAARIRRFHLAADDDQFSWSLTATFGDTEGRGAMWKVETIAVDPDRGLLLVAEEEASRMALVVYTVDGEFTGTVIGDGIFRAEPEGVALWARNRGGVWIATDQHEDRSVFHLFDRETYEHLGAFTGLTTANTDGIAATSEPSGQFPSGGVIAVHDDQGVSAFDWRQIIETD